MTAVRVAALLVHGGVLFGGDDGLLPACGEAGHEQVGLGLDGVLDLLAHVGVGALKVLPGLAGVVHQGEEVVLQPDQLEVLAGDVGHLHVVSGGGELLKLLAGEDVQGHHVNLGAGASGGIKTALLVRKGSRPKKNQNLYFKKKKKKAGVDLKVNILKIVPRPWLTLIY